MPKGTAHTPIGGEVNVLLLAEPYISPTDSLQDVGLGQGRYPLGRTQYPGTCFSHPELK